MRPVPGICDRCGQRYPLKILRYERRQGKKTWKVCPICFEKENPQERDIHKLRRVIDKQQVYDPRPDKSTKASRSLWNWNPVGHEAVMLDISIGNVTVKIGE